MESQAIDRTHRIGQTRRVFAYRLIARHGGEEKVLQLQQSKRDLADAIITADNSLISKLGKERCSNFFFHKVPKKNIELRSHEGTKWLTASETASCLRDFVV